MKAIAYLLACILLVCIPLDLMNGQYAAAAFDIVFAIYSFWLGNNR